LPTSSTSRWRRDRRRMSGFRVAAELRTSSVEPR
jgi:hypothetical protein